MTHLSSFVHLICICSLVWWIIKTDFKLCIFDTIWRQILGWAHLTGSLRRVGFGRQTFPSHFSSFHEGLAASSSKLSGKPKLAQDFINIKSFHLWHWDHPAHVHHTTRNIKDNTVTERKAVWGQNVSFLEWIAFYCNPLALPACLSIIHTGWWRRGLETTTTLTPVDPTCPKHLIWSSKVAF